MSGNYPPRLLTTREAAAFLQVHEMTIYRWAKEGGILPMFKVGGRWRCRKEDLEKIGSSEARKEQ
jgi:excisionase family DNA binding protein